MSAQYRNPAPDPGGSSPARLAAPVEDAEPWASNRFGSAACGGPSPSLPDLLVANRELDS